MSHFTTLKTTMVELQYIKKGLNDLGYPYEEGEVSVRGYRQGRTHAQLKIAANARYDIGFRKNGDNYEMVADWWGIRNIKQKPFAERLTQRYAYHATLDKLQQQGFTVAHEQSQTDGNIHLMLRRMI